jgi:hypothetical protein
MRRPLGETTSMLLVLPCLSIWAALTTSWVTRPRW